MMLFHNHAAGCVKRVCVSSSQDGFYGTFYDIGPLCRLLQIRIDVLDFSEKKDQDGVVSLYSNWIRDNGQDFVPALADKMSNLK